MSRATHRSRRNLREVRLGFVPLLDAAPLLVARDLGLFEKWGIQACLSQELGWASVREKLLYGELDVAHAPGLMAFSVHLGLQTRACPIRADVLLSRQGNAITLSKRLWQKGARDIQGFRQLVRAEYPRRMTFAVVSLFSSHHFILRAWLERADLDPDLDVRFVVLPPSLVGEHMREGTIDGFCVGEPWNSASVLAGDGWMIADSSDICPRHPEKVLLARESFVWEHPEVYRSLRQALGEACAWCHEIKNRASLVDLIIASSAFPLDRTVLANALEGTMDLGASRSRPAKDFILFQDGDPLVIEAWSIAQFLQQARHLGCPGLPSQINLALARRLFNSPDLRDTRKVKAKASTAEKQMI